MSKRLYGVDLGGTTVKMGLFDTEGNVITKWEIPTVKDHGGKHILPDIAEAIKKNMAENNIAKEDVIGVGIGVPGPVDKDGVIYKAANLGWGVFSVRNTLSDLLDGIKVEAGNDANVAALGEMWKGGGKGHKNMVAVTLGTGVGGGIIIDGRILTGSTGAGGEIGHIHVEDNETESCGCGNKGCLEQYTSATGVVRLAKRRLAEDDKTSVLRDEEVNSKTVWDAVKISDSVAIEIANTFGKYLGKGLAAVAGVVNPEIFVIGGGVSKAGEILIDYIKPSYQKYVFNGSREVKFALATLGNDAGIYGAAKLVLGE
ncbi:MAG: ROK family glucokinase [Lachnospiraceae bacterium]|nr:ROK family glucokinase [Lachnospiraceae bacterium]